MGSLYRKYRPRSLDEVVGQPNVVALLKSSLTAGASAHAYLLSGPHGVGKTSIARILAHEINQMVYDGDQTELDIIEIDAASNNGVDDIRELRERVNIAPANAAKKIYIIDEVHMLSKSAFNALLKTLEEPPEYVVFILATTEPEKLPETIISRVQRYNFRTIDLKDIADHLGMIAKNERIAIEPDALTRLAEYGQGSFRDSIGALDQLRFLASADHAITADDVETTLGIAPRKSIEQLLAAYREANFSAIARTIDDIESRGISASSVAGGLIESVHASLGSRTNELPLLDALLEVDTSNHPYLRLLVILTENLPSVSPSANANSRAATPAKADEKSTNEKPKQTPKKPQTKSASAMVTRPTAPKLSIEIGASKPFAWPDFLASIKAASSAVYSILASSGHDFDGEKLAIYAGNAFAVKKLETAKYRNIISEVATIYAVDAENISLIPSKKPPSDMASASIAAIMGGGEEVSLDAE